MDIRVLKDETTFRLKDFFNDLSTKLSKNSTNQILHSHILEKIYSLITEYSERTMDGRILLDELLNLYAQVDISKAGLLMDQIGELDSVGIAGLQIDSDVILKPNCSCYINNCVMDTLSLRYSNLNEFLESVVLFNSFFANLKITFDASESKQLMYGLDFEEEVWAQLKLLLSDANDVQIKFS